MFETIQQGLTGALRSLRGKGKLSEANMREGLELVRQALLEADVSYDVAKDFIDRVSVDAIGEACSTPSIPRSSSSASSTRNSST